MLAHMLLCLKLSWSHSPWNAISSLEDLLLLDSLVNLCNLHLPLKSPRSSSPELPGRTIKKTKARSPASQPKKSQHLQSCYTGSYSKETSNTCMYRSPVSINQSRAKSLQHTTVEQQCPYHQ